MEELKFIPIYKGEYNATRSQETMDESEEPIIIEYSSWIEWTIILAAIGYFMYAIIR